MPLYWFVLVLSALAAAASPRMEVSGLQAVMATAGMLLAWLLLSRVAARGAAFQVIHGGVSAAPAHQALTRQLERLRWCGLAVATLCLVGFGLSGVVRQLPGPDRSLLLQAVLLLIPGLVATAATWWAEHRFLQCVQGVAPMRRDASEIAAAFGSRLLDRIVLAWDATVALARLLLHQLRLQGGWLIAPVLVLLAAVDLSHLLIGADTWGAVIVPLGMTLVGLPLALPWMISRIWHTRDLDHPPTTLGGFSAADRHAGLIRAVLTDAGLARLQLRCWETQGTIATALVAGFVPRFRILLLSDLLLARLRGDQVAMVVLHEAAHLRRWHLPLRMLALTPLAAVARSMSQPWAAHPLGGVLLCVLGALLSLALLLVIAHRTELDADRQACRVAARAAVLGYPRPSEAAEALIAALETITADQPQARRGSWLHPSVATRSERLRQWAADLK